MCIEQPYERRVNISYLYMHIAIRFSMHSIFSLGLYTMLIADY